MKYSNDCRRLAQLLVSYRDSVSMPDPSSSSDRLKPYKDLLIDLYPYDTNVKDKLLELLKYQYHFDDLQQLRDWHIPQFPISAGMFTLKGVKQGFNYKIIMHELRDLWKKSDFQATESDLLNEALPAVLKTIPMNDNSVKRHPKMPVRPPAFTLMKKRKIKEPPSPSTAVKASA